LIIKLETIDKSWAIERSKINKRLEWIGAVRMNDLVVSWLYLDDIVKLFIMSAPAEV